MTRLELFDAAVAELKVASAGMFRGPQISSTTLRHALDATKGLDTAAIKQAAGDIGGRSNPGNLGTLGPIARSILEEFAEAAIGLGIEKLLRGLVDGHDRNTDINQQACRASEVIEQIDADSTHTCDAALASMTASLQPLLATIVATNPALNPVAGAAAFQTLVRTAETLINSTAALIMGTCEARDEAIDGCFQQLICECESAAAAHEPCEVPAPPPPAAAAGPAPVAPAAASPAPTPEQQAPTRQPPAPQAVTAEAALPQPPLLPAQAGGAGINPAHAAGALIGGAAQEAAKVLGGVGALLTSSVPSAPVVPEGVTPAGPASPPGEACGLRISIDIDADINIGGQDACPEAPEASEPEALEPEAPEPEAPETPAPEAPAPEAPAPEPPPKPIPQPAAEPVAEAPAPAAPEPITPEPASPEPASPEPLCEPQPQDAPAPDKPGAKKAGGWS